MSDQQGRPAMNISTQQIVESAGAGLDLLSRDTTLVPGDLRKQVAVLEIVLTGIAQGRLAVVSPEQLQVQSDSKGGQQRKKTTRKKASKKTAKKTGRKRS